METAGQPGASIDVVRRVRIDKRKLRDLCRKAGLSHGELQTMLGFAVLSSLSRWLRGDHRESDERLFKLARVLGCTGHHEAFLQTHVGIEDIPDAFWRDLGLKPPPTEELPADVTHAIRVLADRVAKLRAASGFREVEVVDDVFRTFAPDDRRAQLAILEEKASEIRRFGSEAADWRDYRMSLRALRTAANDPRFNFDVANREDLSSHSILSFVYRPPVKNARDRIFICENVPERVARFELAKFLAWRLMLTDAEMHAIVDAFRLPEPPAGRLNFADDEEVVTRLARGQIAARLAAAVIMPLGPVLQDVRDHGIDLKRLALKYGTSFEVVARRLVALGELGKLPDLHVMKLSHAGTLIYKSGGHTTGIMSMQRRPGGCSKWAAVKVFDRRDDEILAQWSHFPADTSLPSGLSGARFFCFAVAFTEDEAPYGTERARYSISLGCPDLAWAKKHIVYARGFRDRPVEVGPACAICPRAECNVRAVRNAGLEHRYSRVRDDRFFFVRKRRPWSPFTPGDLKFLKSMVQKEERNRLDGTDERRTTPARRGGAGKTERSRKRDGAAAARR